MFVDYYIGFAYSLQLLLIIGSCIASLNDYFSIETIELIDFYCAVILASLWVIVSAFYLSLGLEAMRDLYEKIFVKCFVLGDINYNDWDERAQKEIQGWTTSVDEVYRVKKFVNLAGEKFKVVKEGHGERYVPDKMN